MFQSNFSRYLVTFFILILLSFSAITIFTSYIVIENTKKDRISVSDKLAGTVFEEIDRGLAENNGLLPAALTRIQNQITYSDRFAEVLNAYIFITDTDGLILYASSPKYRDISHIRSDLVKYNVLHPGKTHSNTLGGIFSEQYFISAFPIYDDYDRYSEDVIGMVFICTPSSGVFRTVERMIVMIVAALFWIFIAAFTALYFVSERLHKPLQLLKQKFSLFSNGDFAVRMPKTYVSEVDTIGEAFNEMAASLEKIETSRRIFLCNISHDLRTPMTCIQGFTEAMIDGTLPPEKHRYYFIVIYKEIKRLSRMVNELLDVSRIEAGTLRLHKSTFDICEMVRLIIISFEERLLAKNIDFNLIAENDHSFVFADKNSIYQVMYNLLDNATKFTLENGKIQVTVIPDVPQEAPKDNPMPHTEPQAADDTEKKSETVLKYHISVYNTGVGIPEENKKKIFDRFYKTDMSRGTHKDGIGVGLFIVKTVMDLHEEPIEVESKENEYCEFCFTLPIVSKPGKVDSFDISDLPPNVMPANIHIRSLKQDPAAADAQASSDAAASVKKPAGSDTLTTTSSPKEGSYVRNH